jgi:hypothetical protein
MIFTATVDDSASAAADVIRRRLAKAGVESDVMAPTDQRVRITVPSGQVAPKRLWKLLSTPGRFELRVGGEALILSGQVLSTETRIDTRVPLDPEGLGFPFLIVRLAPGHTGAQGPHDAPRGPGDPNAPGRDRLAHLGRLPR